MFLKSFPIWGSNVSYMFLEICSFILYVQYLILTKKSFVFNYVYIIDLFSFKENQLYWLKLLLFRKIWFFPHNHVHAILDSVFLCHQQLHPSFFIPKDSVALDSVYMQMTFYY